MIGRSGDMEFRFPFNPEINRAIKSYGGRFNPDRKLWFSPLSAHGAMLCIKLRDEFGLSLAGMVQRFVAPFELPTPAVPTVESSPREKAYWRQRKGPLSNNAFTVKQRGGRRSS